MEKGDKFQEIGKIRKGFSHVPIIGGLAYCHKGDHAKAMSEFFINLIFSTATFWFSTIIMLVLPINDGKSTAELFKSTFQNGELFIFCVSFLGPVFLLALEDPSGAKPFPGRRWHTIIVVIIAAACSGLYALYRAGVSLNMPVFLNISIFVACCALGLRYLAIVYHKSRLAPDEYIKHSEDNFVDQMRNHRAQQ